MYNKTTDRKIFKCPVIFPQKEQQNKQTTSALRTHYKKIKHISKENITETKTSIKTAECRRRGTHVGENKGDYENYFTGILARECMSAI